MEAERGLSTEQPTDTIRERRRSEDGRKSNRCKEEKDDEDEEEEEEKKGERYIYVYIERKMPCTYFEYCFFSSFFTSVVTFDRVTNKWKSGTGTETCRG